MRLLVSVTDDDEARAAVAGGVDVVDVKNPAEGSLVTDPLGWLAALQFRRWTVRKIRQVAFSGVDDEHARRSRCRQHFGQRRHHLLQERDVVSEGLTEAPG